MSQSQLLRCRQVGTKATGRAGQDVVCAGSAEHCLFWSTSSRHHGSCVWFSEPRSLSGRDELWPVHALIMGVAWDPAIRVQNKAAVVLTHCHREHKWNAFHSIYAIYIYAIYCARHPPLAYCGQTFFALFPWYSSPADPSVLPDALTWPWCGEIHLQLSQPVVSVVLLLTDLSLHCAQPIGLVCLHLPRPCRTISTCNSPIGQTSNIMLWFVSSPAGTLHGSKETRRAFVWAQSTDLL